MPQITITSARSWTRNLTLNDASMVGNVFGRTHTDFGIILYGMKKVFVFSDISERNNDYSDTHDFWRGWVGEVGVLRFFVLKVPDYESAMLMYFYIFKKLRYRSHFDPIFMKFRWLVRVHSWVNPIVFGNSLPNRTTTDMGENVPPKRVFRV